MNNFIKEELECLHNAIDIQLKTIPMSEINASKRRDLMIKIQSMIDNYQDDECDHRSNGYCYIKGEITIMPSNIYKCKNCDRLYKHIFKNGECTGYETL